MIKFVEKTVAFSATLFCLLLALVGLEYETYIPASTYLLFSAGAFWVYTIED